MSGSLKIRSAKMYCFIHVYIIFSLGKYRFYQVLTGVHDPSEIQNYHFSHCSVNVFAIFWGGLLWLSFWPSILPLFRNSHNFYLRIYFLLFFIPETVSPLVRASILPFCLREFRLEFLQPATKTLQWLTHFIIHSLSSIILDFVFTDKTTCWL